MRRYKRLDKRDILEALNELRNAFLAAKDGNEVDKIMDGLLTHDEKLRIGRRILIAGWLTSGFGIEEIVRQLKVGKNTVMHVSRRLEKYKECFDLIAKRQKIVEKEYQNKKYRLVGGSQLVFKRKEYTGFKRKDVKK
ncbi:MAG: hypothetical protein A3C27_01090 [Candidatus Levybacteria bacterium RIFCSPHIGHO2_02_FULL_39_36]|nr:MAG: hypothetical protein UT20_C0005G0016 [Candidatus Levybacteria bacterium GW2011_GWA1_39_11]KKR25086.1 MAG: hypothetical protein UT56_C0003G0010 [Candidatus Levybacteria bacterium GW2011_GWB1_39_7]KKR25503.1 MAG: hypothetical protein UT57_C0067G0003 [Microgenomates group bacterium GW2011_GWC1_39_7]OGH15186.1 MAG: hypothetical protein A2689_01810 [Candidatus Levybacteria bacterium RIFCSPHIGHO2_01_FULL_38_96]OGH25450.1 MAG: hypothetical protein A3E68_01085 [Candidatus Levybacteria bacterium